MRNKTGGKRWLRWGTLGLVVAAFYYFFPPFHVVKIDGSSGGGMAGSVAAVEFSAPQFVEKFWNEQLQPAAQKAADAGTVLTAMRQDLTAARVKFGRTAGVGGSTYFFVSGTGKIVSKKDRELALALPGSGEGADIVIPLGILFGNAVRDGCGLLDVNSFASSPQFNSVSTELNRMVEEKVLSVLRQRADVGIELRFGGIIEVGEDDAKVTTATMIPVFAEVKGKP